jgi:hypothetical protein
MQLQGPVCLTTGHHFRGYWSQAPRRGRAHAWGLLVSSCHATTWRCQVVVGGGLNFNAVIPELVVTVAAP